MASNRPLQGTFTSQQAATLFREHTGFDFHPTVPGTLLARSGILKLPSTSRPSTYAATHWPVVWDLMFDLAHQRCRYDRELQRPRICSAPVLPSLLPFTMPTESAPPGDSAPPVARHPRSGAEGGKGRALRKHPTRRFIEVAFAEKDEAKLLGALWEPAVRKWYVPAGLNRRLFRWPDALLPPEMCAIRFPSDKPARKPREKKSPSADRSTISGRQIHRTLDERLDFLLDKPD